MIQTSPAPANGSSPGRAHVAGLISPHRLGSFLPAMYQEDNFAQRWTAGLDAVLAPIFNSLDNLESYLDPQLAPTDFLDWLGTWMGLVADETWPVQRRRAFVSQASALHRMRGTPRGLAAHVEIFSGGEVEIVEHGGASWSATAGAALPGSSGFDMLVRVRVDDPASVDVGRLDTLVGAAKPAHLTHRVEVIPKATAAPTRRNVRPSAAEARREPPVGSPAESPLESPPPDDKSRPPDDDGSTHQQGS